MNKKIVGRKRQHQITIRFDDKEYHKFKSQLMKTEMTQREYVLKLIMERPIYRIHELDSIEDQLRKIGVNINQIARKANSNNIAHLNDLRLIREEQRKIWQLLKQFKVEPQLND